MIPMRSYPVNITALLLCLVVPALLLTSQVHAFTADSLSITIAGNGDATATFQYSLEGVIENAIPESVLRDQLIKGLSTSSEPPQIISFDKSDATLMFKNFAVTNDVPTGTEYQTESMNFKNAQIALENSAVSTVITADFSPKTIMVTFPDGYTKELISSSVLPSMTHTVIDPAKAAAVPSSATPASGKLKISAIPENVRVYIDSSYAGGGAETFPDIAPGRHTVELDADGYLSYTSTVMITAGNTSTVFATLDPVPPTTRKSGFSSAGAVAMAVVAFCCVMVILRRQ